MTHTPTQDGAGAQKAGGGEPGRGLGGELSAPRGPPPWLALPLPRAPGALPWPLSWLQRRDRHHSEEHTTQGPGVQCLSEGHDLTVPVSKHTPFPAEPSLGSGRAQLL